MNVSRLILCLTLILTVQCVKKNEEIKQLSKIIRYFTAKMAARYLYFKKYMGPYNSAFSGISIIGILLTMHSLGSDKVKAEIRKVLDLPPSLEKNVCDILNVVTTYDAFEEWKSNVAFNGKLFHRPGMTIREEAMKSSCVAGNLEVLNFTDQDASMDTINDFFPNWVERVFMPYLPKPLADNTNEVILNRLILSPFLERPFYYDQWHRYFSDIRRDTVYLSLMHKVDDFFFTFYKKHNVYLVKEYFVGDRFSYVIILPKYKTKNRARELYNIFNGKVLSEILLKATSLTNKTRMGVKMPMLEINFRVDLTEILPPEVFPALKEEAALSRLTSDLSNMTQYPYSEFTDFNFWDEVDNTPYNVTYLNVDKPFAFVIMDNKFDIPIHFTLFTGVTRAYDLYAWMW